MTKPHQTKPTKYELIFDEQSGYIVSPAIAEAYAVNLAEGDHDHAAWKSAGGSDSASQKELKGLIDNDPAFRAYVDDLTAANARARQDTVYGEAIVMINLTFREARAKRDKPTVVEMVKLRMQAAQGVARLYEKTLPPPEKPETEAKPTRSVGKPTAESPQSSRNPGQLRQELIDKGMKNKPNPQSEDGDFTVQ